ncbi:phospholipase D-like domain-containing protein [Acinetobacter baumannii]|nr:phospholipase D-like domain-containing protein [Acinetobacter baumannii]
MINNSEFKEFFLVLPFGYISNEFKIKKNNQWNVLDLILLRRICESNITISELISESNINRQLIIQLILPYINEGWVILIQKGNELFLEATTLGRLEASKNKLETSSKEYNYNRDCIVNLITGEYIGLNGSKSINYYNYLQINDLRKSDDNYIFVDELNKNNNFIIDFNKLLEVVIKDNEELVSYKDPTTFIIEDFKYLIFNVKWFFKQKKIDICFKQRFDSSDSLDLSSLFSDIFFERISKIFIDIFSKSKKNDFKDKVNKDILNDIQHLHTETFEKKSYIYKLSQDEIEVFYGGENHKKCFFNVIENACDYLVIHSTFFGMWNLDYTLPLIEDAAKRGVEITLLWGKDDFEKEDISPKEKENFIIIQDKINDLANKYKGLINLHDIQTGSHSKFILTNHKEYGHTCILGSCNWFFTQFDRYEASCRISNTSFVKDFLNIASIIAAGRSYISNDTTRYLSELSNRLVININKETNLDVEIKLLFKNNHYEILHLAQRAKYRLSILSDKASNNVERAVWSGLKYCQASIYAFYSTPSNGLTHNNLKSFATKLRLINSKINLSHHNASQKNHGKLLAWDKDHLVVTSLNWMSSDASSTFTDFDRNHELGIYIKQKGIEKIFRENFLELNKK